MSPQNLSAVQLIRRYHFAITIGIILLVFTLEGFFLYRYFYDALVESRVLLTLREQANIEELKTSSYRNLIEFYQAKQKKTPIQWDKLRDPFTSASSL